MLGYVLRYAGMLEESAHECDAASGSQTGKLAVSFLHLDFYGKWERHTGQQTLCGSTQARNGPTTPRLWCFCGKGKWRRPRAVRKRCQPPRVMVAIFWKPVLKVRRRSWTGWPTRQKPWAPAAVDPENGLSGGRRLLLLRQKIGGLVAAPNAISHDYCAYEQPPI